MTSDETQDASQETRADQAINLSLAPSDSGLEGSSDATVPSTNEPRNDDCDTSPVEAAPDSIARPNFFGSLDDIEPSGRLAGWARTVDREVLVEVQIVIDEVIIGHAVADQKRSDLAELGWGDCAFWFQVPDEFCDGTEHRVEARFAASGAVLRNSPRLASFFKSDSAILGSIEIGGGEASKPSESDTPALPSIDQDQLKFVGSFDGVEEGGWAAGWARHVDSEEKVVIEAWIDGELIGEVVADQYRDDLRRQGVADCAFWFGIPEEFLDGREHSIALRYAGSEFLVAGSPRTFAIRIVSVGDGLEGANLIGTPNFDYWPAGLRVSPRDRFEEIVGGWYFDCRRGTEPQISFEADKPSDIGLPRYAYAMRVTVEEGSGTDGYMRLVVPIAVTLHDLQNYRFSLGLRRSPLAPDEALHVAEIFVATVRNMAVDRVLTLRRTLKPRGTLRLANLPVTAGLKDIDEVVSGSTLALVIELRGSGELTIFSPQLTPGLVVAALDQDGKLGEFEDPRIRGQVNELKLSPIWQRHVAVAAGTISAAPIPAISRIEHRALSAVPFIQIVVPVFNATVDVENLLRSIIRNTDTPMEVLLFDDGSGGLAEARISAWEAIDPRIRYFRHAENVGYTRNINFGLQTSVSEHVVLLNSDTVVTHGWLRKLYSVLSRDETIAGVGPLSNAASWQSIPRTKSTAGEWVVNSFDEKITPDKVAALLEQMDDGTAPDFPLLNGFCTLFRKAALEQVGYFDDGAFPKGYGEENDLCLRLTKAGWSLRVAPDTYVHHSKSKSFGTNQRKELSKAANQILRGKHPEIDFGVLEERMQNDPTINRIRRALVSQLGVEPQPGSI